MSKEQNAEAFRRLIEEGFNKGKLDIVDELFASSFVDHQSGIVPPTVKGVKGAILSLRTAFPDLELTIDDMISDDSTVWARLTGRGTHRRPFMGLPPTGRTVATMVVDICRFENGQIVEHWGVPDLFSTLADLCIAPQPPHMKA